MTHIDFDHFTGNRIADEIFNNLDLERRLMIIKNLQPTLRKDGHQWIYILGEMPAGVNIQITLGTNHLAGWGDTPNAAMDDFIKNFYNEKAEPVEKQT